MWFCPERCQQKPSGGVSLAALPHRGTWWGCGTAGLLLPGANTARGWSPEIAPCLSCLLYKSALLSLSRTHWLGGYLKRHFTDLPQLLTSPRSPKAGLPIQTWRLWEELLLERECEPQEPTAECVSWALRQSEQHFRAAPDTALSRACVRWDSCLCSWGHILLVPQKPQGRSGWGEVARHAARWIAE